MQTLSGTIVTNGSTVVLKRTLYDTTSDVLTELNLKNTSNATHDYKAIKRIINLTTPQKAYFCFAGGCFDTATISPTTLTLDGGQIQNNFSAHVNPNSGSGSSLVYYKFYNTKDGHDTIGIYFQTELWHLGINDLPNAQLELGTAYPNPANDKFTVSYKLRSAEPARLVLQNVLGLKVYEETLSGENGKVQVAVSSLPEGVYLYSLYMNGKSFSTKKLLVRH
ncbi:MAG: T9SS type A sorting domain-containing protein [Bacteroidetes bacterium]|nr:T9SS type A sorting domain-containing protein [Bacteroidota bacterium]